MSLQEHIRSLRARHAALDDEIVREAQRPAPNDAMIYDLKRQKLKVKDTLNSLERA